MDVDQNQEPDGEPLWLREARQNVTIKYNQLTAETRDARLIAPFLKLSRWHIYTADYVPKNLVAMVDSSCYQELTGLKKVVKLYYAQAAQLLEGTGNLIKKRLNSPDPKAK